MRVVRRPHREEAEPARRRRGERQLRDREGARVRAGGGDGRRADRPSSRSWATPRPCPSPRPPRTEPRGPRGAGAAHPAAGQPRAVRAGGGDVDVAVAAVRVLAVGRAHARRAGRRVGRAAVPPGGVAEPAARRGHDGHADLHGHARRVRVVAVRAVPRHRRRAGHGAPVPADDRADRRRRQHLPRGRGRRDDVHPRRPVLRGAGQAPCRLGAARAAVVGGQGRRGAARRAGDPGARSSGWPSATGSWCGRGRRSPPTAWSRRARRRWTRAC